MTNLTSAAPGVPLAAENYSNDNNIAEVSRGVRAPILAGLLFVAIGAAFVVFGLEYRLGTLRSMGPGMFPVVGGVLVGVLGLIVAGAGFRSSDRVSFVALRPLVAITASVGLFAFLVDRAGLAIAAPLLIVGVVLATGQGSWKLAVGLAVPLTVAAIVVFPTLLGVPIKVLP